jgi:hypothetical protein
MNAGRKLECLFGRTGKNKRSWYNLGLRICNRVVSNRIRAVWTEIRAKRKTLPGFRKGSKVAVEGGFEPPRGS